MSWVLNAIVTWDTLEDTPQRLGEVNAQLAASHGQTFANTDDDDLETRHAKERAGWWRMRRSKRPAPWYGGPKYMEATFFGAAFNHVPPADVIAAVAEARWEYPSAVQLFLKDQEDDRWTVYEFEPRLSSPLEPRGDVPPTAPPPYLQPEDSQTN